MHVVISSNADRALTHGLEALVNSYLESDSRNGPVLRFPMPLTSMYTNPRDRVLFNSVRDCNPFLHLFESMWMLKGRNDLSFVEKFTPQMAAYSDNGITLNGAYGHRWRCHFHIDQIHDFIVPELRKDPNSRRAHLQIWDGYHDVYLLNTKGSADVPCNVACEFEILGGKLNMVVFNRSNDLVWGAYGANIVHFSFLQEYIACALGVEVGAYHQVSRNAHVYTENHVTKRLIGRVADGWALQPLGEKRPDVVLSPKLLTDDAFYQDTVADFQADLETLFNAFDFNSTVAVRASEYGTKFMREIVSPMGEAFELYKANELEKAVQQLDELTEVRPYDWLVNASQWLNRRINARKAKHG